MRLLPQRAPYYYYLLLLPLLSTPPPPPLVPQVIHPTTPPPNRSALPHTPTAQWHSLLASTIHHPNHHIYPYYIYYDDRRAGKLPPTTRHNATIIPTKTKTKRKIKEEKNPKKQRKERIDNSKKDGIVQLKIAWRCPDRVKTGDTFVLNLGDGTRTLKVVEILKEDSDVKLGVAVSFR